MPSRSPASRLDQTPPPVAFEPRVVREQMERIVLSSPFRQSRRYPALLRYVVERTLDGHSDELKERTLGVEVFQRSADYDTNLDPVVRITAGEVRKRIAQYYHEDGHSDELRIDLPPGSYVPQFRSNQPRSNQPERHLEPATPTPTSGLNSAPILTAQPAIEPTPRPQASRRRSPGMAWRLLLPAAIMLLAGVAFFPWHAQKPSGLDSVWAPVLRFDQPLLISSGAPSLLGGSDPVGDNDETRNLTVRRHMHDQDQMIFSDVKALTALASFARAQHHGYTLQMASTTTFADLRSGPAILLGGYDNPWTMRSTESLRYRFRRDTATSHSWIEDSRNLANRSWDLDFNAPYSTLSSDYAIVARFTDENTHQPVLVAAGIGENGTKAAAEFLTDPEMFRSLMGAQPVATPNFEVVLQTQVIHGISGPPRLLAREFW